MRDRSSFGPPEHRQGARRRRDADGRPYFVMELVQGVPITDYCDQRQLTPAERLELFVRSARRSSTPTRRGSSTAT